LLGPIGIGASIGINLLSIGFRIYNREPVIPKSKQAVLLEAIANNNFKIDALSEHMDNKLD
jgi:hypothetical protein